MNSTAGEDVTILALGTTLLRNRWRIIRWMIVVAAISAVMVLRRPRVYVASASFVSQSDESNRSGLASIAGQFGVSLGSSDASQSPDFYAGLLESRVLLLPITRDTLVVPELRGQPKSVLDLVGAPAGPQAFREERGVTQLQKAITLSIAKATGVIQISVTTQWRSVSLALARDLIQGVNDYNERTRQSQGRAERQFIEGRLDVASNDLRGAENRLTDFEAANRDIRSPYLNLELQRLQRDVALRQSVFTTLTQAYEEARIQEVRDTPVISVFEAPYASTLPKPRGLLIGTVIGLIVGAVVGAFLSLVYGLLRRRREDGNGDAEEFARALREAKGELLAGVKRFKVRSGS
jgi:uncharacterized protein involved in exopolysaccharide biosynthesis